MEYFTKLKRNIHISLLLVSDDNGNNHYWLIKDLTKLLIPKNKTSWKTCIATMVFYNFSILCRFFNNIR